MSDFLRLNTALILPPNINRWAIEQSKKLAEINECQFVLDGVEYIPHVTLYSPEYPKKNLNSIVQALSDLSKTEKPVLIKSGVFRVTKNGYVVFDFMVSSEIMELHKKIVRTLNPCRENHIREKIKLRLASYSEQEQKQVEYYGKPDVMDYFIPHITLTRFPIGKINYTATAVTPPDFMASKIALYGMGPHGTCSDLFAQFSLL